MYNTNKEKKEPEEILLLNKDSIVASGLLVPETEAVQFTKISGKLPLGLQSPASWIENRKASKHNRHLQDLMKRCGCDTLSGFIDVTHAASVNDTFWVKKAGDDASWDDVSLYRNEFKTRRGNSRQFNCRDESVVYEKTYEKIYVFSFKR